MLTPDTRTVLLDDLQAPPGYEVDHAVATTFTLDLTAAMLPPFAIAGIGTGGMARDPVALLQALRRASDRVDIFCQTGSIAIPRSADLVAFLEPMVHQVIPPRGGLFHPKVWILRFVAPDHEPKYRLLVLSRNLTHDNAWDIAVRLDSEGIDDHSREHNAPLVALLQWLPEHVVHIDEERHRRVAVLADEIAHVRWEHPEAVESIRFHTGGVPGQPIPDFTAGRHLVISPFVTADGLETVTAGPTHKKPPTLVSRQETLDALDPSVLEEVSSYTLAADADLPVIDDREVAEGATASPADLADLASQLNGLHAKVYVLEPTAQWATARLLMGSSNATGPALSKNVEFLIEVVGHRKRLGIDQILPVDGSGGLRPLVEPYVRQDLPDTTAEEARRLLQSRLRTIAAIAHRIDIAEKGSSSPATYSADVAADEAYPAKDGIAIHINLLTRPGVTAAVEGWPHLTVGDLGAADITPCIAVTATDGTYSESTVVLGRLYGAPEDRLDSVIAQQINSQDKFQRLVLLLLSLGNPVELAALMAGAGSPDGATGFFGDGSSGILELVLRALASGSRSIDDLDRVVDAVDAEIMPEGFADFWREVREARLLLSEESP